MTPDQLNRLVTTHDPVRLRLKLEWVDYLHHLIKQSVSFCEVLDIASYKLIGDDDYNRLLLALYTRAGATKAIEALHRRLA